MTAPNYLTAYPLTVFLGPLATAFPDSDAVEDDFAAGWVKLGTEGNRDYESDGVTATNSQTVETWTGAGSTAPRKAFRTDEGLVLGLTLADLTPEQFALALDDATVTTVAAGASQPGEKHFNVLRGLDVHNFALLARGQSTVDNALTLQFEWPTVFQSGEPAPVFTKGTPAGLALEFTALQPTAASTFGTVRIQTAVASS